jgi:hypothetical protein
LHQQGELTEDEYRLIKSRLARDAARQFDATSTSKQQSAKAAIETAQREGSTEKTDDTVQDDKNRQVSRSTDEPPNLNSTTVKSMQWDESGKMLDSN